MVNPICLYLLIIALELSADFILLHFLLQSLMKNIQNPIFGGGTFRSSALFLLKAKSTSSSSLGFNHRKTILHSKNQRRSFRFIHSHHPSFHSLASIPERSSKLSDLTVHNDLSIHSIHFVHLADSTAASPGPVILDVFEIVFALFGRWRA